jgi:2-polyprenyl-3-methyl-5-hydroxy-6-metoxy-1,4-benzoquinol methylase
MKASNSEVRERERRFHDAWADSIDPSSVLVAESFTGSTSPEARWLLKQMGNIRGKRLLELGSGAGEGAVYFARMGAKVVATDVSTGMLDVVQKVAAAHGTSVETVACSAEDLSAFSPESFDIVYAANLLHHVNIQKCLDEVKRVLKPGGIAGFWDPVAHNPVINIYRRMAKDVRTQDEHPIRRSQIMWFRDRFVEVRTEFFWFTTLLIFVKFYVIDRIHPSSDRYWKRIITHEQQLRWLYRPLEAIDKLLLHMLPPFRWWCWNIAIVVRKAAP